MKSPMHVTQLESPLFLNDPYITSVLSQSYESAVVRNFPRTVMDPWKPSQINGSQCRKSLFHVFFL